MQTLLSYCPSNQLSVELLYDCEDTEEPSFILKQDYGLELYELCCTSIYMKNPAKQQNASMVNGLKIKK